MIVKEWQDGHKDALSECNESYYCCYWNKISIQMDEKGLADLGCLAFLFFKNLIENKVNS